MIGRLTGRVSDEGLDGTLLVDVAGVGYEVIAPLGTRGRAAGDGTLQTLHVHTHVREDALQLFGFATPEDRLVFRTLIAIPNVGPKLGLSVLSALSSSDLVEVVARRDLARLTAIPGVGKKTAERLVLELKDKLGDLPSPTTVAAAGGAPVRGPAPAGKADLVQSALIRMGYRPAEAERAVAALGERVDQEDLGTLVREALAFLTR